MGKKSDALRLMLSIIESKELATACPPWWGESVRTADRERGKEDW